MDLPIDSMVDLDLSSSFFVCLPEGTVYHIPCWFFTKSSSLAMSFHDLEPSGAGCGAHFFTTTAPKDLSDLHPGFVLAFAAGRKEADVAIFWGETYGGRRFACVCF